MVDLVEGQNNVVADSRDWLARADSRAWHTIAHKSSDWPAIAADGKVEGKIIGLVTVSGNMRIRRIGKSWPVSAILLVLWVLDKTMRLEIV